MSRSSLLKLAKTLKEGTHPGDFSMEKFNMVSKFKDQPAYVPYFWEEMTTDNRGPNGEFEYWVQPADEARFPELRGRARVLIYEDQDGFVRERPENEKG